LHFKVIGLAVRVLAPVGALIVDSWPAAIGALLIQEAALWFARRVTAGAEYLFLVAYALRVAIVLPLHYLRKPLDGNGSLFQDDYTNNLVAEWLVRIARGEGVSIFPGHQHVLDSVYPYILAGLYAVFGYAPLLPKMLNVALSAVTAVIVFDLARRAFNPSAARIAALGAVLIPSLVLWSIVSVKESLVLLLVAAGLSSLQRLSEREGSRASHLVLLGAVVALLFDLRYSASMVLFVLLLIVALARTRPRIRGWQVALAGAACVVVLGGGVSLARSWMGGRPALAVLEDVVLQIRHRRAQEAAGARSQFRTGTDSGVVVVVVVVDTELPAAEAISDTTPFTFTGDVLEPLGYGLLAPAPWQARSDIELAASFEMLIWYVYLAASLLAWRARPRQRVFVLCLAVYGVATWFVLAATEGNLGNLTRHRIMLAPTILILGGAGLDWLLSHAKSWPSLPTATVERKTAVARGKS